MATMEASKTNKDENSFKYHFDSFAASTAFHGFVQYQQSDNWIKQSLWLALILLCSALTIKDLYETLAAFIGEELTSKMEITRSQLISYPGSSMCVEFNTTMLEYRPIDIANASSVQDFLTSNAKFVLEMFYCRPQNTCDEWDHEHWNDKRVQPALMLVTSLITELTNLENPYIVDLPIARNEVTFSFFASQPHPANFSEVLQRAGLWLCRMIRLRAVFFKQDSIITEETDVCEEVIKEKPRSTLWIGAQPAEKSEVEKYFDQVCFMLGGLLEFSSWKKSRVFLIFNEMKLYVPSYKYVDSVPIASGKKPSKLAIVGTPQVHFKFRYSDAGFSNRSVASQSISLAKTTRRIGYNLHFVGEYKQYPKRINPACGGIGYMKCAREKWALQFVSSACRCFPFSWALFYDYRRFTDVLCTDPIVQPYKELNGTGLVPRMVDAECLRESYNFSDDNEAYNSARAKCLPPCTDRFVTIQYDVFSDPALSVMRENDKLNDTELDESAIVSLRVADFSYLSVAEEQPKIDMPTLWAQIGGNLGMWLGGSFIALLHLVVTIVDCVVHKRVARSSPGTIWATRLEDIKTPWNEGAKHKQVEVGGAVDETVQLRMQVAALMRRVDELENRNVKDVGGSLVLRM